MAPHTFYRIVAHIAKPASGNYRSIQDVPTFYLPADLHGLTSIEAATEFAHHMLSTLCGNASIFVTAYLVEFATSEERS